MGKDAEGDDDLGILRRVSHGSEAVPLRARAVRLRAGRAVQGTIVAIGEDMVFVDVGTQAEAWLDRSAVIDEHGQLKVRVGDIITATVADTGEHGPPRLVLAYGAGGLASTGLELAAMVGTLVIGEVRKAVKAGLEVDVGGVQGFCPASQVELGYVVDLEVYVGQRHSFRVLEVRDDGRLVVSRKALLLAEREQKAAGLARHIEVGAELDGIVRSIQPYGAFVDIGGLQGLAHVSEMVHTHAGDPSNLVTLGESVRVKIIAVQPTGSGNPQDMRISLSMKGLVQRSELEETAAPAAGGNVPDATVVKVEGHGVRIDTPAGQRAVEKREALRYYRSFLDEHRKADPTLVAAEPSSSGAWVSPSRAPKARRRAVVFEDSGQRPTKKRAPSMASSLVNAVKVERRRGNLVLDIAADRNTAATDSGEPSPEPWGDVERAIYDPGFAERMKTYRLARARRASDWAEQWLTIEEEYRARRRRARALLGDWVTSVALHDGHLAEVVLTARALLMQGPELLVRAPWVRHLHVTDYVDVGPSLFSCPSLRGMQSLGLRAGELEDDDIDALAASPFVDGLRWLDLAHNHLGQRSLETLASCFMLSRLEYVGFEGNAVESPVDHFGTDALDGAVVDTNVTAAGRALERLAGRALDWLHAPDRFPYSYPPSPLDVAMSV